MDRLARFRQALVPHLGQTLTPELCAALEHAAFSQPDESIDPGQFAAVQHGGYTIHVERFREVLPELTPLHEAHWAETESYRKVLALNPNYQALFDRERAGRLIQFTARYEGRVVAHLRMFIGTSLHTQTEFADEDALFCLKEHRGGFLVIKLMRYAEACLRQLGVREFRSNSKLANRADVLMRRLGYEPVALQFCKIFPE
jgi:hypothetical protein